MVPPVAVLFALLSCLLGLGMSAELYASASHSTARRLSVELLTPPVISSPHKPPATSLPRSSPLLRPPSPRPPLRSPTLPPPRLSPSPTSPNPSSPSHNSPPLIQRPQLFPLSPSRFSPSPPPFTTIPRPSPPSSLPPPTPIPRPQSPRPSSPSPLPPPNPSPRPQNLRPSPPSPALPSPNPSPRPPSPQPPTPLPSPPSPGLLPPTPSPRAPSPRPRPTPPSPSSLSRNGVRLFLESGSTAAAPRGRLEVSSLDAWFTPSNGAAGWSPVCDQLGFNESTAQAMCVMLGYTYGRSYYNPTFTSSSTGMFVAAISCKPRQRTSGHHRRHLMRESTVLLTAGAVGGEQSHQELLGGALHASRRLLTSPEFFTVNAPSTSPFTCTFKNGESCPPYSQLAGIQCANTALPPAQPPRPPSPPRPLSPSDFIRRIGGLGLGILDPNNRVEPNLCVSDDYLCAFSRFELKVPAPDGSGTLIWAPLCAPEPSEFMQFEAELFGSVACSQALGGPGIINGIPIIGEPHFSIPTGMVTGSSDFNPATVRGWFTVTGSPSGYSMVQDFVYTVTTKPCSSGTLLAVMCQMSQG